MHMHCPGRDDDTCSPDSSIDHGRRCSAQEFSAGDAPLVIFSHPDTKPSDSALFGSMLMFHAAQGKAFSRLLREAALHPGQVMLCRILAESPNLSQRELAERVRITPATVTIMIQKMEKAGLIERRVDGSDQRVTRISLTEQGHRADEDASRLIGGFLNETIGQLSPEDSEAFSRILAQLHILTKQYQTLHWEDSDS